MRKSICAAAGVLSAAMSVLAQERAANTGPGTKAAADTPAWLKRDTVIAGSPKDAPDGVVFYYLGERVVEGRRTFHQHLPGIYCSPIRQYRPAPVGGTEKDYEIAHMGVSDDGEWLLYSCTAAPAAQPQENISGVGRRLVLCRADGGVRADVPTGRDGPESLLLSGFYRQSPFGSEIFYSRNNSTILARRVDWTSTPPRFGAERVICSGIAWDGDDSMAVSGSHLHGRLGELSRYVTIPEDGRGTAGPDNLWRFTGKSKFGCAVTLSHDGRLAISNPTQLDKVDRYPTPGKIFPIWHRGFVVLPFKEDKDPSLDIADHYFKETVSANWVFAAMRPGNHDFSQWRATNHNEYVIGRQISRPSTYGCWLVHWPTNTWTRLTPPEAVVMGPAAYLLKATSASAIEAPQSRPAAPPDRVGNPSGQDPRHPAVRPPACAPSVLTVLARLTRASTVPTPKSIAPYKQALVFNVYRIDEVLHGQLGHKELLIGHWAVRDGKTVPHAERTEGRSYRMTIEAFDRHPRLREFPRHEAMTRPALPVFYDQGE